MNQFPEASTRLYTAQNTREEIIHASEVNEEREHGAEGNECNHTHPPQ